tara:strand:+ start:138 stop:1379 length:1242 start_codon:yes stop_codon:yes gene_type:complete
MLKFNLNSELEKPSKERLDYLRKQVKHLQTLPHHEQRSPEWFKFREGLLTASDWGTVLGNNKYSKPDKVLINKCDKNAKFYGNAATEWGKKYEEVANKIYEARNNVSVIEFGCIKHPTVDFLGASPDGITPDGVMVEIKCPYRRKIIGIPPKYYEDQVRGQLEVCKLDRCDFLECKLEETEEDSYFSSNYDGDYTKNKFGLEKGIVAVYLDRKMGNVVFDYSELGINREELEIWKKNIKYYGNIDYIFSHFSYWNLLEVSCIPIYREDSWFDENLPILRKFWDQVLYYRNEGLDKLNADLKKKKEDKKRAKSRDSGIFIDTSMLKYFKREIKKKEPECLFSSNSFENSKKKHKTNHKKKHSKTFLKKKQSECLFSSNSFKTAKMNKMNKTTKKSTVDNKIAKQFNELPLFKNI